MDVVDLFKAYVKRRLVNVNKALFKRVQKSRGLAKSTRNCWRSGRSKLRSKCTKQKWKTKIEKNTRRNFRGQLCVSSQSLERDEPQFHGGCLSYGYPIYHCTATLSVRYKFNFNYQSSELMNRQWQEKLLFESETPKDSNSGAFCKCYCHLCLSSSVFYIGH